MNNLAFICSPFRDGDMEENIKLAKRMCRWAIKQGYKPFAPHLMYPQFLNDNDKAERRIGMECGKEFLYKCNSLIAYQGRVSDGMACEIHAASNNNISITFVADRDLEGIE